MPTFILNKEIANSVQSNIRLSSSVVYGVVTWSTLCVLISNLVFGIPTLDVAKYVIHILLFNSVVGAAFIALWKREFFLNCHMLLLSTWIGYAICNCCVFVSKTLFSNYTTPIVLLATVSALYLVFRVLKNCSLYRDGHFKYYCLTTLVILSSTVFIAVSILSKTLADVNMLIGIGKTHSHLLNSWPISNPFVWDADFFQHYFVFQHLATVNSVWSIDPEVLSTKIYSICNFPILLLTILSAATHITKNRYIALLVILQLGFIFQPAPILSGWCGNMTAMSTFRSYTGISSIGLFLSSWALLFYNDTFRFSFTLRLCLLVLITFVATGSRGASGIMIGVLSGALLMLDLIQNKNINPRLLIQFVLIFLAWLLAMVVFYNLGSNTKGISWINNGFSLRSMNRRTSTEVVGPVIALCIYIIFNFTFLITFFYSSARRCIEDCSYRKMWIVSLFVYLAGIVLLLYVWSSGGSEFKFPFYAQILISMLLAAGYGYATTKINKACLTLALILCVSQIALSTVGISSKLSTVAIDFKLLNEPYAFTSDQAEVKTVEFLKDNYLLDAVYFTVGSRRIDYGLAAHCPNVKLFGSRKRIARNFGRSSRRFKLQNQIALELKNGTDSTESVRNLVEYVDNRGFSLVVIAPTRLKLEPIEHIEIYRNDHFKVLLFKR